MKEQSNVQPQNRNGKSRGSAYMLSNGQRVPVLFRLQNLQAPVGKHGSNADPIAAATQDKLAATPSATVEKANAMAIEPNSSGTPLVGPSWMRRNAYRVTVLCLLIATVLLLNNNRSRSSNPFEIAGNSKSKNPVSQSMPDASKSLALDAAADLETPQPISNSSPDTQKSNTIVETIATDSGTKFVITNSAAAPESNSSASDPTAVTQLLTPQSVDQANSQSATNNPSKANSLTVPAQQVSTGAIPTIGPNHTNNSSSLSPKLESQANRYAVAAGGESVDAAVDDIPSTNALPPDPSDLFALFQQQSQIQSPDETVRAMRPRSQPSSNWQAMPVSRNSNANGFANTASDVNLRASIERTQGAMNYPVQGQSSQNASRQFDPSSSDSMADGMQPPRTQYQPIYAQYGSDFGSNASQNLYSTPSMPQSYQQAPYPAQAPYQPIYPSGGNPGYQNFMDSQLYDAADQSSGNYIAP